MGGGWLTPRPGRFTPGNDTVSTVQEAGWAPGPVWKDAEMSPPTGIRLQDRPGPSVVAIPSTLPRPTDWWGLVQFKVTMPCERAKEL